MSNVGWPWMYIWSSYWCIFSTYHMIGERTLIHLLFFSDFEGSNPKISWSNQLIMRTSNIKVHEEFSNSSIYVQYSVCTSLGCRSFMSIYELLSKFQIYYYMNKFQIYYFRSRFQNNPSQLFCLFRRWIVISLQPRARSNLYTVTFTPKV